VIFYYSEKLVTAATYTVINLGFVAKNIILVNNVDSTEDIQFSWDGTNLAGELAIGEPLTLSGIDTGQIWVKSASGGMTYRIWAWAN